MAGKNTISNSNKDVQGKAEQKGIFIKRFNEEGSSLRKG